MRTFYLKINLIKNSYIERRPLYNIVKYLVYIKGYILAEVLIRERSAVIRIEHSELT